MESEDTVQKITKQVENASTEFEKTNTDVKRKYLIWNIHAFNTIASAVSVGTGSFGTGYPFYALDKNLKGQLPIIGEQLRYNRQLVVDGKQVQKSIYLCKSCLEQNYDTMPDLKTVCKPCPNMINELKPRKLVNRLPDLDMWLVCEDGKIEEAQTELSKLLEENGMHTSDVNPFASLDDVIKIVEDLKAGKRPKIYLPIDSHIIEYSKLKELIEQVPETLKDAKEQERIPYLPIYPKSYRKVWQYDDEAYNFIYDFLSAFTSFNFPDELQESLDNSRAIISKEYTTEELFEFLTNSATPANFRRFHSIELENYFKKRVEDWKARSFFNEAKKLEKEKLIQSEDDAKEQETYQDYDELEII
jgi:hypothetical protein